MTLHVSSFEGKRISPISPWVSSNLFDDISESSSFSMGCQLIIRSAEPPSPSILWIMPRISSKRSHTTSSSILRRPFFSKSGLQMLIPLLLRTIMKSNLLIQGFNRIPIDYMMGTLLPLTNALYHTPHDIQVILFDTIIPSVYRSFFPTSA